MSNKTSNNNSSGIKNQDKKNNNNKILSTKNQEEQINNKINNILQKDTGSMFSKFKTSSFSNFNQNVHENNNSINKNNNFTRNNNPNNNQNNKNYNNNLGTTNGNSNKMEKITMTSHYKPFTNNNNKSFTSNNNGPSTNSNRPFNNNFNKSSNYPNKDNNINNNKDNSYVNSLEKLIYKKNVNENNSMFNNKFNSLNLNKSINDDEKKSKSESNINYNKILDKFISHKHTEQQNNYKKEYAAILGTSSIFSNNNVDKNKHKIQKIIKTIQEESPIEEKISESLEINNKNEGPMVKKIEQRENYFFKRSNRHNKKKNINNFPNLTIGGPLTLKELAFKLNITEKNLLLVLKKNHLESLSKQPIISIDDLVIFSEALGIEYNILDNFNTYINKNITNKYNKQLPGSPIIAIVGHIDHGKTSLIEKLTEKTLCNKEAGSITQKISSYSIQYKDRYIRLIDTPGHSVFKNARNLAIEICDLVVLIVSANDGVQEQTIDSIKFLQQYNIPFVTVITKIDIVKKYDDIYNKLMQHGVIPNFMGGDVEVIAVSAKTGENIPTLLDYIVNMSDMLDLNSDIDNSGWGYVLETWKSKMGIKGSILLKNGNIKNNDIIFFNNNSTVKVKNLYVNQEKVSQANMYQTIEIEGLDDYVNSNEKFWIINDEKDRKTVEDLWQKQWNENNPHEVIVKEKKIKVKKNHRLTNVKNMPMAKNEDGIKPEEEQEKKIMKIVICTRSYNDIEAVKQCLNTLTEQNKIGPYKILTTILGAPSSTDLSMIHSIKGCLIIFNVDLPHNIVNEIKNLNIPLFYNNIIYTIINELEEYYNNQFNSQDILEESGEAEIVAIFKIQKKFIAGCIVRKGLIIKNQKAQLVRNGKILGEGIIESLKNEANDIKEAKNNQECGIFIPDITEKYQLTDRIVCWRTKRIVKTQDGKIISEKYI